MPLRVIEAAEEEGGISRKGPRVVGWIPSVGGSGLGIGSLMLLVAWVVGGGPGPTPAHQPPQCLPPPRDDGIVEVPVEGLDGADPLPRLQRCEVVRVVHSQVGRALVVMGGVLVQAMAGRRGGGREILTGLAAAVQLVGRLERPLRPAAARCPEARRPLEAQAAVSQNGPADVQSHGPLWIDRRLHPASAGRGTRACASAQDDVEEILEGVEAASALVEAGCQDAVGPRGRDGGSGGGGDDGGRGAEAFRGRPLQVGYEGGGGEPVGFSVVKECVAIPASVGGPAPPGEGGRPAGQQRVNPSAQLKPQVVRGRRQEVAVRGSALSLVITNSIAISILVVAATALGLGLGLGLAVAVAFAGRDGWRRPRGRRRTVPQVGKDGQGHRHRRRRLLLSLRLHAWGGSTASDPRPPNQGTSGKSIII